MCWLLCLLVQVALPQAYTSKDQYTGNWETPESWVPLWDLPVTDIKGIDIAIDGNITVNDSLAISGNSCSLTINDTLEIKGNLSLGNNVTLTINDNGILIVRGTLTINNLTHIAANGYFIITGNIKNITSNFSGSFTSNDNPVKLFVGGMVHTVGLGDYTDYPVLKCNDPVTVPYPNSNCSYGNFADLMNDPIYAYFKSKCTESTAGSNSPVCAGETINLTTSEGTGYSWSGPDGFTSNEQNPSITNATVSMSGTYTINAISADGCTDTANVSVIVNAYPVADAGIGQELNGVHETTMNAMVSATETGEWSLVSGSGNIQDIHSPATAVTELSGGENVFLWTVNNAACMSSAEVIIVVNELMIPSVVTPNGDGKNDFFLINGVAEPPELIIFNCWGNVEYTNDNYQGNWEGRNNGGVQLPNETYFYILKFKNGEIRKGSVLIRR